MIILFIKNQYVLHIWHFTIFFFPKKLSPQKIFYGDSTPVKPHVARGTCDVCRFCYHVRTHTCWEKKKKKLFCRSSLKKSFTSVFYYVWAYKPYVQLIYSITSLAIFYFFHSSQWPSIFWRKVFYSYSFITYLGIQKAQNVINYNILKWFEFYTLPLLTCLMGPTHLTYMCCLEISFAVGGTNLHPDIGHRTTGHSRCPDARLDLTGIKIIY